MSEMQELPTDPAELKAIFKLSVFKAKAWFESKSKEEQNRYHELISKQTSLKRVVLLTASRVQEIMTIEATFDDTHGCLKQAATGMGMPAFQTWAYLRA